MADLTPLPDEAEFMPAPMGPLVDIPVHEDVVPEPLADVDTGFNPAYREPFRGLLYLGILEEHPCTIAGHSFTLATPSLLDKLNRGPLHKEFLNTVSAEKAWSVIVVASWLRAIDGVQMPLPLNGHTTTLAERFRWVLENIQSDVIIGLLHERVVELEERVANVIEEIQRLGKAST